MNAISLWVSKTPDKPSRKDLLVAKILRHNADMVRIATKGEYWVVTNLPADLFDLPVNIRVVSYREYKDFENRTLNRAADLEPNFSSDFLPFWMQEFIKDDVNGMLYVDSDFVLSNPLLLAELDRQVAHISLFPDQNFYRIRNKDDTYTNAHIVYLPPQKNLHHNMYDNPYLHDSKLRTIQKLWIQELNYKGSSLEYFDLGPRFYNSLEYKTLRISTTVQVPLVEVQHTVLPNVAPFGRMCISEVQESEIFVPYTMESLGIHLLFSMYKTCGLELSDIKLECTGITLKVKQC